MGQNSPVSRISMTAELVEERILESGNLDSFTTKTRLRPLETLNTEDIVAFKNQSKIYMKSEVKTTCFQDARS